MILTVTLNAAIDRTYRIEGFALDVVHRPSACWIVAGGKGINVARTVTRLGGVATATGILGGHNGRFIAASLREEGIEGEFVWVRGESRTCIAAVDPERRSQTEINENGPTVGRRAIQRMLALISRLLRTGSYEILVLSGSVPPGVPEDVYGTLTDLGKSLGVRVVLDSSGEPLRQGVAARPWLVKPNLVELEQLTGRRATSGKEAADIAESVLDADTRAVVVTMGPDGCVCVVEGDRFYVAAPEVPFISAVGSGDALLGALLVGLAQGWSWREAVAYGVAAGAANACVYGAGFVDRQQVDRLVERVTATPV